jgi:predicted phage gp36 major capsid-like protein
VDEDLRKRCRYLAHLPEAADVTFVEADLESVVGKDSVSPFDAALKSRRSRRIKKDKKDDRARLRAEEKAKEKLAEEHWVIQQSAMRRTVSTQREEDELRAFLQGGSSDSTTQGQGDVQSVQNNPGAWGERSFASTLSGPATGMFHFFTGVA